MYSPFRKNASFREYEYRTLVLETCRDVGISSLSDFRDHARSSGKFSFQEPELKTLLRTLNSMLCDGSVNQVISEGSLVRYSASK